MADLDLTALRVRLAELEGFDATGLLLRDAEGAEEGIVVYDDGRDVLVHGEQDPQWWTKDQDSKPYTKGDEEPHVSAADAATRDPLARWCAGRLGKSVGSSGPCWGPVANSYEGGGWGLLPRLGHGMCIFMRPDWLPLAALPPLVPGGESVWVGVPALADIDPADPRLLPDGSRLVDALALVAVARHLGGSRG